MSCDCKSQGQCECGKVLLVDNGEAVWPQIVKTIQQAGFQTTHSPCGQEANEVLQAGGYSAVIIHQSAAPDALAAFCRDARSGDEQLVIIPMPIGCNERLESELFDIGVDDIVTDRHTPQALATYLAVRIASWQCR